MISHTQDVNQKAKAYAAVARSTVDMMFKTEEPPGESTPAVPSVMEFNDNDNDSGNTIGMKRAKQILSGAVLRDHNQSHYAHIA